MDIKNRTNENNFITKKSSNEREVIEFYDAYASDWDSRFNSSQDSSTNIFLQTRYDSFLEMLGKKGSGQWTALELGVGTGQYVPQTCNIFKKIVAVDGSTNMLHELDKKLDKLNIKNVETIQQDVTNMKKLKNESFDVIYFFGLLEHIINTKSFFSEMSRTLKPNGIIIGITPNRSCPWYSIRSLVRSTGKHCTSDTYYNLNEIRNMLPANLVLEDQVFWGIVPAGLNIKIPKIILKFESYLQQTFFNRFLGGITFRLKKV